MKKVKFYLLVNILTRSNLPYCKRPKIMRT